MKRDLKALIGQMTLEEKASLCSGSDFWHTQGIERLGIPAVMVTDGPLKGHEALIRKINRYKRVAYLDMRMFGRTKTIKVGLEIVRKNP